ncbi:endonuclease domain-containing protein [Streptomyces sp. GbtcB6]|uniref:endonuclease domain-containing protein n=1 Tax=Streptomyces sp. GbtcB6 TaxID=2824751 RepID=UPI001C30E431|nr:endonuclease domain-containing protein [Streptomyces sp. GbtcB6]
MELRALQEPGGTGILLTSRALDAGWNRVAVCRRLRAEGWTRIRNGAWAEPGRSVDLTIRLRATQLLSPQLLVSHRSAARLWRIETLNREWEVRPGKGRSPELEFTDPSRCFRQSVPGVRVHRIPVAEAEVTRLSGLRVTDVPRTLADLLRSGPRNDALVAVESALGYRTVDGVRRVPLTAPAALSIALEPPLRGAPRAREWLLLADRHSGSPAETVARLHMLDADLRPESQVELRVPGGGRRYLDFLFREKGLAVEIEGYAYHGTRSSHRRDVARFNEVLRCSEVRALLRFTAEDVFHHPPKLITQIRTVLASL